MRLKLVPIPSGNMVPERDSGKRPVLECIDLGITFGGLKAVEGFSMAIGPTEIAGLDRPTARERPPFNLLTKVYQPTTGTILLGGKDTHDMDTAHVNRCGIARTFQNIRLFQDLSVEDNVKTGMDAQMRYGMWSGILRLARLPPGGESRPRPGAGAALPLRHGGPGRREGRLPALRRPAPPGDRPRAGHQPLPAAAG